MGAVQDRLTWVGETAAAESPVGAPGGFSEDEEVGWATASVDGFVLVPKDVTA